MAIIAMRLYVTELKNSLSKYLTFAKAGQEMVIRERNVPVAKLVPFSSESASDDELALVAAGKLRLPTKTISLKHLLKIPTGKLRSNSAVKAVLADDSLPGVLGFQRDRSSMCRSTDQQSSAFSSNSPCLWFGGAGSSKFTLPLNDFTGSAN